jgi:hypothetical protein
VSKQTAAAALANLDKVQKQAERERVQNALIQDAIQQARLLKASPDNTTMMVDVQRRNPKSRWVGGENPKINQTIIKLHLNHDLQDEKQ